MGEFWHGQVTKGLIQGDFLSLKGPKSVRFSRCQFRLGIETLDCAAGNLPFSPEPVEEKLPMTPKHAGDLLHRFYPGAKGSGHPSVQELPGPEGRNIFPKALELLFQEIASHRLEIVFDQLGQTNFLFVGQVFRPLQKNPSALGQEGLFPLGLQLPGFLGPNLVDRLAEMAHDVEPVQHMNGLPRFFGNDLQVRPPHIGSDKPERLAPLFPEPAKEPQKGFHLAVPSDPQEASSMDIDLIHQGQVPMAFLPGDLIDADGSDAGEIHVLPSPVDGHLDSQKHGVPLGGKGLSRLLPGETLRPSRQKPGKRFRHGTFGSVGKRPRHRLHPDPASTTIDPTRRIHQEDLDVPERHELEPPHIEPIVSWSRTKTPRTDRTASPPGFDLDLQRDLIGIAPTNLVVDKRLEFLDPIEDSLE